MKEKSIIDDFDEDFGFTILSQDDIPEIDKYRNKMNALHKMILPLLKNLLKDPDKDVIHWPNRQKRIEKFIADMDKLVNDECT
jgi:hypothetical protein